MWSLLKKIIGLAIALIAVSLILNLKIADRPARDWAWQAWENPTVQGIYQNVHRRVSAVLNKDISVEDAFKPDLATEKNAKPNEQPVAPSPPPANSPTPRP